MSCHLRHRQWVLSILIFSLLFSLPGCSGSPASPTPTADTPPPAVSPTALPSAAVVPLTYPSYADKIGVDLGDMYGAYVEIGWRERAWEVLEPVEGCGVSSPGDCAPLDENGWPMSDAQKVIFDLRPFGAWWEGGECPNCPDGDFTPNIWGVYQASFNGKAEYIYTIEGQAVIGAMSYDESINTTSFEVTLHKPAGLLFLGFVGTQRTATAEMGTGITNLRITLPGFAHDSQHIFTDAYLAALAPFDTLRFMNQIGGNNIDPGFDASKNTIDWADRSKPGEPEWLPGREGSMPWDWVVELANLSQKNIWINIPIHASDDYIYGLAEFLKANLHSDAIIYVEYSNEVWNSLFTQYTYNKQAAVAEVEAGSSNLNQDGLSDPDTLLARRFIRRTKEISDIFAQVYGQAAINQTIRVVYSWFILTSPQAEISLAWLKETYGDPAQYFYALAGAGYFSPSRDLREITNPLPNLNVFFQTMERGSQIGVDDRIAFANVAHNYDLRIALYESGPDNSMQLQWDRSTYLMDLFIQGHNDPRMGALIAYDMYNNWWANSQIQGDMYIFFTLLSPWSRWGLWGTTRDITDLNSTKYQTLAFLSGQAKIAPPIPLGIQIQVGQDSNHLTWEPAYGAEHYTILRRKSGEKLEPYAVVNTTSFVDEALSLPSGYIYAVAANNQYGESLPSEEVSGAFLHGVMTPTPKPIIIPVLAQQVATPPILDGLKEDLWNTAQPGTLGIHLSGPEDGDQTQVYTLWDDNYLYVLFEVHDSVVHTDVGQNQWDDDSVEVYIDGGNEKGVSYDANDDQLVFVFDGEKVWAQRGRGDGTEFASARTDAGYNIEIKIPWDKFGVAPAPDLVIGFEAMRNDDDNLSQGLRDGKWALNAKSDEAWDKPGVFGELILLP